MDKPPSLNVRSAPDQHMQLPVPASKAAVSAFDGNSDTKDRGKVKLGGAYGSFMSNQLVKNLRPLRG